MVTFTGLGSLPGVDFGAALRFVFDAVGDFPFLPELPARGPWAGMVGRGLGLPDGLPAQLDAGEWRLASAPGVDQRRARTTWRDDLDRLEEIADGYDERLKLQVAGPWTLAASTGVATAGRVLADAGARRDLAGALAHGVGELLDALHRRLPAARLVLQVDEPSLPSVLAGAVPTPGGFFRHAAIDLPEVVGHLKALTGEPSRRGLSVATAIHCCAPGLPIAPMLDHGRDGAGFDALSLDLALVASADLDPLAAGVEAGRALWLGALPTADPSAAIPAPETIASRVQRFADDLGVVPPDPGDLVITPACGLAGFTPATSAQVFRTLAEAAKRLDDALR